MNSADNKRGKVIQSNTERVFLKMENRVKISFQKDIKDIPVNLVADVH